MLSRNSLSLGIAHSEVRYGTERNCAKKCFFKLIHLFFFVLEWFGTSFQKVFFFRFMTRKEIPSVFLFRKMVQTKLRSSKCFSLLENDSERNFELFFIFREIAHNWIPSVFRSAKHAEFLSTEWIKTSVCSVFHRIISFLENGNPYRQKEERGISRSI